jgi:superoxide dismutase, Cu-Zn family
MKSRTLLSALLLSTVALYGCGTDDARVGDQRADTVPAAGTAPGTTAPGMGATAGAEMSAQLIDRQGQPIGTVRLSEAGQGVQVAIEARNLPAGQRGIHFHETGRCDPPSFESAGSHFAPQGRQHGLENPQGPHAGDMENLNVGQDGTVNTTITTQLVTLRQGQPNSLVDGDGTALVIHAEQDDQRTDPSGNSGDRIACAMIGQAGATGAR